MQTIIIHYTISTLIYTFLSIDFWIESKVE